MMQTRRQGLLLAALVVAGIYLSCGRQYHLVGRVVTSSLSASTLEEITGQDIPPGGDPVTGALVTLFHQIDDNGDPVRESRWQASVQTDEEGRFDLKDYAAPAAKVLVGLEVEAPGFGTAYTTYWDLAEVKPQVFFVQMSRN